MITKTNK